MPHSLKAKLSGLRHKQLITDDEYRRLKDGLDLLNRKPGRWINVNEGKWNTIPSYKCTACGEFAELRDWSGTSPFCPWCGARMEVSDANK